MSLLPFGLKPVAHSKAVIEELDCRWRFPWGPSPFGLPWIAYILQCAQTLRKPLQRRCWVGALQLWNCQRDRYRWWRQLEGPLKKVEAVRGTTLWGGRPNQPRRKTFLGCLPSLYRASLWCSTWGRKTWGAISFIHLPRYCRRKNFSRGLLFYSIGLGLWRWKRLTPKDEGFFLDDVSLSDRLSAVWFAHGWLPVRLEITALAVWARLDLEGWFQFFWDLNLCGTTGHFSQLIHNCPWSSLWDLS